jgi:alginate O-acetyltransferase complex protein AlgI
MAFQSSETILLLFGGLLLSAMIYALLPFVLRRYALLLFSYVFYCSLGWQYAILLLLITLVSYGIGLAIEESKVESRRGRCLLLGLVCSFGLLFTYKYASTIFYPLFRWSHLDGWLPFDHVIVPLGLSFYTFRIASYLIDVYWEAAPAQRDFFVYAGFVAFFPQIVSGPIQKADDFFEQVESDLPLNPGMILEGLVLIALGCLKKVLADRMAVAVAPVFAGPGSFAGAQLLLAAYGFTLQLYFDFSGITDIARGAGQLYGIKSPPNFAAPFLSGNVQEFWKRWHMSLTTWLRDYVFTPVMMSLRSWGRFAVTAAIVINMALMGIWHDLTVPFLVFGLVHAFYLVVYVATPGLRARLGRLPGWWLASRILTFHLVVFAFLFFRARSILAALLMLRGIFRFSTLRAAAQSIAAACRESMPVPGATVMLTIGIIACVVICHLIEMDRIKIPRNEVLCYGFLTLAMLTVYCFALTEPVSFIYQMF